MRSIHCLSQGDTHFRKNRLIDIKEEKREELAEIGQDQFRQEGYYDRINGSISKAVYQTIKNMIFEITQDREYIENISDECKATLDNYDSYYFDGQSTKPKYVVHELKLEVIKLIKIMQKIFSQIIFENIKKII